MTDTNKERSLFSAAMEAFGSSLSKTYSDTEMPTMPEVAKPIASVKPESAVMPTPKTPKVAPVAIESVAAGMNGAPATPAPKPAPVITPTPVLKIAPEQASKPAPEAAPAAAVVNPIEVPAPPAIAKPVIAGNPAIAHKYPNLNYDKLIDHVMGDEGGYQNGANDHGGETKYGISKRSYPHLDIPNITQEMAREIFKKDFFNKISGDKLFEKNAGAAVHLADVAFNSGPGKAAEMLSDVLGIPKQKRITQEMIDMIPGDESIVKKLSARRHTFYNYRASVDPIDAGNLKGWMNRLDSVNAFILSGMEGQAPLPGKKASKQLKAAGKAFTAEANASISSAENKAVVDQINAIGRSVVSEDQEYIEATKEMNKKPISSIGEVFRATFDEHFLLNTNRGLDMLQQQNIIKASEANRKAMGDKFTKSWMETLTIGAVGGVNDLKAFEAEVREFKKINPDVKLPYESSASVHELTLQSAKNIEEKYNQLNSGSFTGGIAEAANKLAHVALGYLPGHIAASLSDPIEAISMAAPAGGAGIAGVAKGAAIAMGGTAVAQVGVQPRREEVGLSSGLAEGAANVGMAGVGAGVIGAASNMLSSLWKTGSKETGKAALEFADNLLAKLKPEMPDAMKTQIEMEAQGLKKTATEYLKNPYGDHYSAKIQYERNLGAAMDDLASNKPVRMMDQPVTRYVPTEREYTKELNNILQDPEFDEGAKDIFNKSIQAWNKIKKDAVEPVAPKDPATLPYSTVPIVKKAEGKLRMFEFDDVDTATKFLASKEWKELSDGSQVVVLQGPEGLYLGRSADLEPGSQYSGRMVGPDTEAFMARATDNPLQPSLLNQADEVRGLKGSEDVEIAKQFPNHTTVKPLEDLKSLEEPLYPKIPQDVAVDDFLAKFKVQSESKVLDNEEAYTSTIQKLEMLHTKMKEKSMLGHSGGISIDEGLDYTQHSSKDVAAIIEGFHEEKSAISQMFSCMVGKG